MKPFYPLEISGLTAYTAKATRPWLLRDPGAADPLNGSTTRKKTRKSKGYSRITSINSDLTDEIPRQEISWIGRNNYGPFGNFLSRQEK
jgi:hypothetical protein